MRVRAADNAGQPVALSMQTALASLACLLVLSSCSRENADPNSRQTAAPQSILLAGREIPVTGGAAPGYVPDSACADCHAALHRSYQQVAMAQSLYRPTPGKLVEDFQNNHFHHEASDRHYRMVRSDDGFVVQRYVLDDRGNEVCQLEQNVDWVVGSGNHVRSYIYRAPSGELFQLPIAWYADSGWNMAPGFDKPDQQDFSRQIGRDCLFCHNAYPDVPAGNDHFGQPGIFPETLPEGIGCQRCHGPGAEHVQIADNSESSLREIRESIVNPARLEPALRDDVCLQCHLQPTSRYTSFVRRMGRPDYSYRPGEPLNDYLLHFDAHDESHKPTDSFEINHHPYRLHQSTCYTASSGEMSCMTCHDPHVKIAPADRAAHYRQACLTCHALEDCGVEHMQAGKVNADHLAANDCVACHMGRRHPEDVVRVVMTDHRILRRPPALKPLPAITETNRFSHPQLKYYERTNEPSEPMASLLRAMLEAIDGMPGGLASLNRVIATSSPDQVEPYAYFASALLQQDEFAAAAEPMQIVLKKEPDAAWAHIGMARAKIGMRFYEEASQLLRRAIELNPTDPVAHQLLGLSLRELNELTEARGQFEEAIRLRPLFADAHMDLAILLARQSRFDEAIQSYEQVLAIDPSRSLSYEHLATIHLTQGRLADALTTLQLGAKCAAEKATVCELLAIMFLTAPDPSMRDAVEALSVAQRAVEADPDRAEALVVLAAAQLVNGQLEPATSTAQGAAASGAEKADCLLIESLAQLKLGRTDDAQQTYAKARAAAQASPSPVALRQFLLVLAKSEFQF